MIGGDKKKSLRRRCRVNDVAISSRHIMSRTIVVRANLPLPGKVAATRRCGRSLIGNEAEGFHGALGVYAMVFFVLVCFLVAMTGFLGFRLGQSHEIQRSFKREVKRSEIIYDETVRPFEHPDQIWFVVFEDVQRFFGPVSRRIAEEVVEAGKRKRGRCYQIVDQGGMLILEREWKRKNQERQDEFVKRWSKRPTMGYGGWFSFR